MENTVLKQFLPDNFELTYSDINKVLLDEELESMVNSANPISSIRTSHQSSKLNSDLVYLTAHQSPLICYKYRNHFRLLSGLFTYIHITKIQSLTDPESQQNFPIFLLKKRPPRNIRRIIILHDLTSNLLEKCFINDTQRINFFLENWFEKEQGKRSIFQSSEWQILFPELKTKSSVSNYLSLSKRDF